MDITVQEDINLIDGIKNKVLNHKKTASAIISSIASILSIFSFFGLTIDIKEMVSKNSPFFYLCITMGVVLYFPIKLYLDKVSQHRECLKEIECFESKISANQKGFTNFHQTWHEFNKISDLTHNGVEVDRLKTIVHNAIISNLTKLKHTLQEYYEYPGIYFSIKSIIYDREVIIPGSNTTDYRMANFSLEDKNLRDPSLTPELNRNIINDLVFNPSVTGEDIFRKNKKSLFYQSWADNRIKIEPSFSEAQSDLCNSKFKGGAVAPIKMFDIPFSLLCIGCTKENVLNEDMRELIAGNSDSLGEYIRLHTILVKIEKSYKIVIMEGVDKDDSIMINGNKIKFLNQKKDRDVGDSHGDLPSPS